MDHKNIIIAIDGPAGSGKSSISQIIAKKLSFVYIDTGAMYRALTLKILKLKIDLTNLMELKKIISSTEINYDSQQNLLIDHQKLTDEIRQQNVTDAVNKVASNKLIRSFLVNKQRIIGRQNNSIMDGRDIGTVVFPKAKLKIFLTSSIEIRAQRRLLQNQEKNINQNCTLTDLKKMITKRDHSDMNRKIGPLMIAKDAIVVDSSALTLNQTVDKIISLITEKQKGV